jgi:hypothetical protein
MTEAERLAMLTPLIDACRWKHLKYGWRTWADDGTWHAEIHAGDRARRGAHPIWSGKGATEEAALGIASAYAIGYWAETDPVIHDTLRNLILADRARKAVAD